MAVSLPEGDLLVLVEQAQRVEVHVVELIGQHGGIQNGFITFAGHR